MPFIVAGVVIVAGVAGVNVAGILMWCCYAVVLLLLVLLLGVFPCCLLLLLLLVTLLLYSQVVSGALPLSHAVAPASCC